MIATQPSPVQPKFSFSKYDGIKIGGRPFRYFETREDGHISSRRKARASPRS